VLERRPEGGTRAAVEISVEHSMSTWDNAALQVIVEEAGGRFSDLRGEQRIDGGSGGSGVPDTPSNDVTPPANTPQGKFEQYCNQNPGACG